MKIIHTSDWHLGQEFYSYDRTDEHTSFLLQLKDIVAEEQPDLLVISGDIYHNATPSNAVMRLFTDYVDQIRRACSHMTIVITAGNHDSSSRLEVNRTLWSHLGVHIVGKIEKEEERVLFNRLILPVNDRQGHLAGYVVALPYTSPHAFPSIEGSSPREDRQILFMRELAQEVARANQNNLPVVMMAHMAISGSDLTGHNLTQGGMDYVNLSELCVDFDYLALGHIHCPQYISSESNPNQVARYSGSPIPVSFDEHYVHSVSVVQLDQHHTKPDVHVIPITNPWPLKTFPKDAVNFDDAIAALEQFDDDEPAYIRLHVKITDMPPQNAMERASAAVANKKCRFCCFKWELPEIQTNKKRVFASVDQMKTCSPLEIAELYYENKFGQPLDDDLRNMLSEVIEQVNTKRTE